MSSGGAVVVRLRGLPTKTSKDDVVAFLRGFTVTQEQVHLQFKERRTSGEAFVLFHSIEEARKACAKDKDFFSPKHSDRYVRVSIEEDVTPDDLLSLGAAAASKAARSRRGSQVLDTVVKVSGLPPGIKTPEVLQLFWGWQARLSGSHVRQSESGAGTEAFLDFGCPEQAAAAVAQRNGTMITTAAGEFQLSVQTATKRERDAMLAAQQGRDGVVRLKALPVRAAADDVLQFFKGFRIKPGGVHVQPFSDNKHSKTALVEFEGAEEAVRALEKDRQKFGDAYGDRYCLVQLISRAEFEEELLRFQGQKAAGGGGASSRSGGTLDATATPATASFASPPLSSVGNGSVGMLPTAAAAAAGFMGSGLPPMPGGMMLPSGYVLPSGVAPVPGSWPMPPPGMVPGAQVHPFMTPPLPGLAGMPGLPWNGMAMPWSGSTAAARYMVQDLTTGQRVFLDPRFNLSGYGGMPPACMASSVVATTGAGAATFRAEQKAQATLSADNTSPKPAAGGSPPAAAQAKGSNGHSAAAGSAAVALHTNASSSALNNTNGHGNGSSGQSEQTGAMGAAVKPSLRPGQHHHRHRHGAPAHHQDRRRHAHQASPEKGGGSGDEGRTNNGSGGGSNEGSDTGSGAFDTTGKEGSSGEGSGADGAPDGIRGADTGGRRAAHQLLRLHGGAATAESEEAGTHQPPGKVPEASGATPLNDPLHCQAREAAPLEEGVLLPPAKRPCVE